MRLIPLRESLIVVIVIALDVSGLFFEYDTNSYVHGVPRWVSLDERRRWIWCLCLTSAISLTGYGWTVPLHRSFPMDLSSIEKERARG